MNNSRFAIESVSLQIDEQGPNLSLLREREAKIVKVLEALRAVKESEHWSTLKDEVFDGLLSRLNKELELEARQNTPDTLKLNRLTGQIIWAEKYSDLSKLESQYRLELTHIRQQLYGTTPTD